MLSPSIQHLRVGQDGEKPLRSNPGRPVTKQIPAYLKLHVEDSLGYAPGKATSDTSLLEPLCEAFARATGWQLNFQEQTAELGDAWSAPVDRGDGIPGGRLFLRPAERRTRDDQQRIDEPAVNAVPLEQARPLALAVGGMLAEIHRLRHALWQREAELAANVPVTARPNEEAHLAERLEAVLKGGADAVSCQAAALYLLDDSTSSLKLRAAYGLPKERLLDLPRPLRGAIADLEALVGHAVVLEDTSLLPHWKAPENFPSAVCVPVSTPTTPLGTLWIFSRFTRDFTPEQTNMIEIVAGRIAADLEREMLITTGTELKNRDKQIDLAARWQNDRLPSVSPLLEQYDVAGWTQQADGVGGDFYDWNVLPDGRLAVAVADAQGKLVEAGLNAAALHAALKSHSGYRHSAADMLQRLNDTLWSASAGDQFASLVYALLHPEKGDLELALAGGLATLLIDRHEHQLLTTSLPPLGVSPDTRYKFERHTLAAGDFLVALSTGVRNAVDEAGLRIGEAAIAAMVQRHRRDTAAGMLARLKRLLERGKTDLPMDDMTLLVVKRQGNRS